MPGLSAATVNVQLAPVRERLGSFLYTFDISTFERTNRADW